MALVLLGGATAAVHAESVYKCVDVRGGIAYQGKPCDAQQRESRVDIPPAPVVVAETDSGVARTSSAQGRAGLGTSRGRSSPARAASGRVPATQHLSYECRMADGGVFYRHSSCPKSIKVAGPEKLGRRGRSASARSVPVSSRPLPRAEACRLLNGGYSGRSGHEYDEHVSTYEHNLGRDPCRWL